MPSEDKSSVSSVKTGDDSKTVVVPALKYELMLRVIAQLQQGKSVQWNTITVQGKARKTLSNLWVKVRAEINALEPAAVDASGGAEITTPVKTPKSAKKRAVKQEDNEDSAATGSPRKKGRGKAPSTPSKVKDESATDVEPKVESEDGTDQSKE